MKVKRYKRIRRVLRFYALSYNIRAPYKVVVDAEFLHSCKLGHIMLADQLATMFDAAVTPCITPCTLKYLQHQQSLFEARQPRSRDVGGALFIAQKSMKFLSCRHDKRTQTSSDASDPLPTPAANELSCIKSLVGASNVDRLIVGAQSKLTRQWIRSKPGVPLLFVHKSVMVMEPPSNVDLRHNLKLINNDLQPDSEEQKLIAAEYSETHPQPTVSHHKKRAKGPNPKSAMKKQKKAQQQRPAAKNTSTSDNDEEHKDSDDSDDDDDNDNDDDGDDYESVDVAVSSSLDDVAESNVIIGKRKRQRKRRRKPNAKRQKVVEESDAIADDESHSDDMSATATKT